MPKVNEIAHFSFLTMIFGKMIALNGLIIITETLLFIDVIH